eukprot:TRINITY_DN16964_c0_g1_i1.p1 TRINITY_DN16964_c0_g1~~TRINITY_DN16964_c0_g1_i1.p1  ORF type:complete len:215 (-),score=0.29 TRINITY_DN16964_c0_g1_i1:162-806(-)
MPSESALFRAIEQNPLDSPRSRKRTAEKILYDIVSPKKVRLETPLALSSPPPLSSKLLPSSFSGVSTISDTQHRQWIFQSLWSAIVRRLKRVCPACPYQSVSLRLLSPDIIPLLQLGEGRTLSSMAEIGVLFGFPVRHFPVPSSEFAVVIPDLTLKIRRRKDAAWLVARFTYIVRTAESSDSLWGNPFYTTAIQDEVSAFLSGPTTLLPLADVS